ncbi:MAG TPA: adenylosuccinate lyase [Chloroflexota bacterium]|nr:adenylosuccinate lyase [Chloroflexota bacterium]
MIEKYTRPEMGNIWSTANKYRCWLRVEVAVAEAWAARGRVPAEALPAIRGATVDPGRIEEIEEETQHDVIAFLRNLDERIGPDARFIHLGLTSSDVVDTALALQLVESVDLLLADVDALRAALGAAAPRYRSTVMMGRTHNVHAEPITFGYKLAVWYAEMGRHRTRLEQVRNEIAVAKISGAVGTHANVPASLEEEVARDLGLRPEEVSTQVVQRDRHATYVLELALLASSLDKMATELRNLQHTEILEVEEPFRRGQQGSSAMPHKRNPILNERISGLARVVRGYAVPALENVVLWHERDISNSSVERVVLPDASILVDYMLAIFTRIITGMRVREDRMAANLETSHGLFFSEKVLTALIDAGFTRPEAYALVQRNALTSWETGEPFRVVLESDPEVVARLSPEQMDRLFDLNGFLHSIDVAFERLGLGGSIPAPTGEREAGTSR